jgi:RNA polymerase sigma-70 factor (family 1)
MKEIKAFSDSSLWNVQKQAAEGNEGAFKIIYYRFYKKLYLFALSIVKTREAAEEIAEDVFIKIWQQRENLANIQNLRVYLYVATKNTSLNFLSKKANESITEPFDHINIDLGISDITPEQILITAELQNKIQQEVDALPPRCKMIFKLVREDGLKYKEVSDILNISVNTIDVQMAIAIKKIGAALEPEFNFHLPEKTRPGVPGNERLRT